MGKHGHDARQYREARRILDAVARTVRDSTPVVDQPVTPTEYERGWSDAWRAAQLLLAQHGLTVVPGQSGPQLVQISLPINGSRS